MNYSYNIEELKNYITDDHIFQLLEEFGGEPRREKNMIISKTICHNHCGYGSHKLYYYLNSQLFKCYTECNEDAFDIFELVKKILNREYPKEDRKNGEWTFPEVIEYVSQKINFSKATSFGINFDLRENNLDSLLIERYDKIKNLHLKNEEVVLEEYNDDILKNLPRPCILPWIKEDISEEVMNYYEICYNPKSCGIVIPHRDINGRLVGIRERTLLKENIDLYGKYRPAFIKNTLYNHPLSYNLYGLYQNKKNIAQMKKVFIFESEKSVLKYGSLFGQENNLSVAVTGSNLLKYQFYLLELFQIEEAIICFDKQYKKIGDDEYNRWVKKLRSISNKYNQYCQISFLFDTEDILGYKDAPIDKGKEPFLYLFNNRLDEKGEKRI